MPYIAYDLDALNEAPNLARAGGITEDAAVAGLVRMWAACFRAKTDTVDRTRLPAFFGSVTDQLVTALLASGFLESTDNGFRVRGAERYLRISEARKEGGRKAKGNLKQHRLPAGSPPAQAGAQPEKSTGSTPALTPSTEHRTPNKKRKASAAQAPPDPRHAPLVKALCDAYQFERAAVYPFRPRDAAHIRDLLAQADPSEIEAAWRRALRHQGYPSVSTLSELLTNLAHFRGTGPPQPTHNGRATAADTDWSRPQEVTPDGGLLF